MTLSPLNTALVHVCRVRNASRAKAERLEREGVARIQDVRDHEFQKGFTAGLSQALEILRTIGEQPVSAANYVAGADDHDEALARIEALVGRPE